VAAYYPERQVLMLFPFTAKALLAPSIKVRATLLLLLLLLPPCAGAPHLL
jgi:hypothetical protein